MVGKDVATALELANTTITLERLDDDERAKFNLGRQGESWCVNESGLYSLVLSSKLPVVGCGLVSYILPRKGRFYNGNERRISNGVSCW